MFYNIEGIDIFSFCQLLFPLSLVTRQNAAAMKSTIWSLGCLLISFSGYSRKPLAIPPTLEESAINLQVRSGSIQFLPGSTTATIGINGNFLGPTIFLNKGDSVQLSVYYDLDEPTTMHWHGLHVPAKSDGSLHNVNDAHSIWSPRIKVFDQAGTYWYHPHLHGNTAEDHNILINGTIDSSLPHALA